MSLYFFVFFPMFQNEFGYTTLFFSLFNTVMKVNRGTFNDFLKNISPQIESKRKKWKNILLNVKLSKKKSLLRATIRTEFQNEFNFSLLPRRKRLFLFLSIEFGRWILKKLMKSDPYKYLETVKSLILNSQEFIQRTSNWNGVFWDVK